MRASGDHLRIELAPLDVAHVAPLRALRADPGVARWWGPLEDDFPFDEPESTRFAVVVDGSVAGLVQHGRLEWPEDRPAYIDIFVGDAFAGRGIGTEVMRRAVELVVARRRPGRIVVDPARANERAIRCYEKVGFRRTGEWRDELVMEYVVQA